MSEHEIGTKFNLTNHIPVFPGLCISNMQVHGYTINTRSSRYILYCVQCKAEQTSLSFLPFAPIHEMNWYYVHVCHLPHAEKYGITLHERNAVMRKESKHGNSVEHHFNHTRTSIREPSISIMPRYSFCFVPKMTARICLEYEICNYLISMVHATGLI